mmetsp:Transcript_18626/g.41416  ORF Transcript_18626/g.41416 Transcript_18626/m.41416 type:complete len:241 (-) Transcript_18626:11-733(-)
MLALMQRAGRRVDKFKPHPQPDAATVHGDPLSLGAAEHDVAVEQIAVVLEVPPDGCRVPHSVFLEDDLHGSALNELVLVRYNGRRARPRTLLCHGCLFLVGRQAQTLPRYLPVRLRCRLVVCGHWHYLVGAVLIRSLHNAQQPVVVVPLRHQVAHTVAALRVVDCSHCPDQGRLHVPLALAGVILDVESTVVMGLRDRAAQPRPLALEVCADLGIHLHKLLRRAINVLVFILLVRSPRLL